MTLATLDLDAKVLDHTMLLIHSQRGHGKTHLLGDMLRAEVQNGPCAFINIRGEDGTLSLSGMGLGALGVKGYTTETIADYEDLLDTLRKERYHAVAIDSLAPLSDQMLYKIVGSARLPDAKVDGERSKSMWGQLRWNLQQLLAKTRYSAKIVLAACASDKSASDITGSVAISPDLFGRLAHGSAGWFDFVGYLTADVIGKGEVSRSVTFAPSQGVVVKQRITRPILESIKIPTNQGGWEAIWTQIVAHTKGVK